MRVITGCAVSLASGVSPMQVCRVIRTRADISSTRRESLGLARPVEVAFGGVELNVKEGPGP